MGMVTDRSISYAVSRWQNITKNGTPYIDLIRPVACEEK